MKFSICIPNYNYAMYIGRTIQSVLDQNWPDLEIVVADNASTDRSVEVVRSFADQRIRVRVNACNVGFAGNLDRAGAMATGDRMIMLSSDDLMRPEALAAYRRVFDALGLEGERTVVGSAVDVIDANDGVTGHHSHVRNPRLWGGARKDEVLSQEVGLPVFSLPARELLRSCLLSLRNPFPFASLCYPRVLYEAVEGYGGARLYNPDKWFAWKLLAVAETAYYVDYPLFGYRWHSFNQESLQAQSGVLKRLVDQYITTFDLPASVLERAAVSRGELVAAFVEQDIALRGLTHLADGQRLLAKRTLRLGQAVYPDEARRNTKLRLLQLLLLLGPFGQSLTAVVRGPALRLWSGAARERNGRPAPHLAWLENRLAKFL